MDTFWIRTGNTIEYSLTEKVAGASGTSHFSDSHCEQREYLLQELSAKK